MIIIFVLLAVAAVPSWAQDVALYQRPLPAPGSVAGAVNQWNSPVGWQNIAPAGTWWRNPGYVSSLSLTTDQQKRMDDVFQQSRLKLIDLTASLDKEEAILEPLLKAEKLDEAKVATQIDRIANARAELEKANARMLLGIRQVLTPEQWAKLNTSKILHYSDTLNGWPGLVVKTKPIPR
jgi:Spy/CpxP family protein refolding chaperone